MQTKPLRKITSLILAFLFFMGSVSNVFASDLDIAVVDISAPVSSVTLDPGAFGDITINMTVTGNQSGTSTFKVYRDWTLTGGNFAGSNPVTFTVDPRKNQDPADTFSAAGKVTVDASQPAGTYTLSVSAFDITNETGASLRPGIAGLYQVTVNQAAPSDTTPPVITSPGNLSREATGPEGAIVTFTATALDDVDGGVPVTAIPSSGSTFPLGETTVELSATDSKGNSVTNSFLVDVVDTTPPQITVPDDITTEATSPSGARVTFSSSASDLVDADVEIIYSQDPGSWFPLGTTQVIATATDFEANETSAVFNVTVRDTTDPELTVPQDITVEATGPFGTVVNFSASATDAVDNQVTINYSHAPGSVFPLGSTIVTVTATDDNTNEIEDTFTVTVQDTTEPELTVPLDMTVEATGPSGVNVDFSAAATDIVDSDVTITYSHAPGSLFPLGSTVIKVTATDESKNAISKKFTITVSDNTAPNLTVPSDIEVLAQGPTGSIVNFTASATDLVDQQVEITYSHQPGTVFPIGTTTVSVTATDDSDNLVTKSFLVNVKYEFHGFFQPLNLDPDIVNTVKAGSAIPIKFSLGGDMGIDIMAAGYPKAITIILNSQAETEPIDYTVTAGSSKLTFDPQSNQYIYVWKTDKSWAGTSKKLVVMLKDGSTHQAIFQFTK